MHEVLLGLGSNLGDRLANLQSAVDLLSSEGVRAIASSRVWETEPVGGPENQPEFFNAVVTAETDLEPMDVLEASQRVEVRLGRIREVIWGPRTIDIDVLLYDQLILDEPGLTIPHPRMHERAFVVLPLLELDPDPVLPSGRRLREEPFGGEGARPYAPPLRLP